MKKLFLLLIMFVIAFFGVSQVTHTNFKESGILITSSNDTICFSKMIDRGKVKNGKVFTVYLDSDEKKYERNDIATSYYHHNYELIQNEIDEFTGQSKKKSNFYIIGGTKIKENGYIDNLVINSFLKYDSTYAISFRTPIDLGCSGAEDNYVIIKLENGEVITLDNDISDIDCSRNAVSTYILSQVDINKLSMYNVSAIRFKQSKYYEDFYIVFPNCFKELIKLLDN